MDIDWDYANKKVHLTMLDYVPDALIRFQHPHPRWPQHQPYPHAKPTYGATKQYDVDNDTSLPLNKADKKYVQEVIDLSYTMPDVSTAQCLRHSAPLRRNNRPQ